MAFVYITRSNENKFVSFVKNHLSATRPNRKAMQDALAPYVENDYNILDILTNAELEALFASHTFYASKNSFMSDLHASKEKLIEFLAQQNKKYAHKISTPAFHTSRNCPNMYARFENIKLPKSFQTDQARTWIAMYKDTYTSFEALNEAFQREFATQELLEEVKYDNSGTTVFENATIEELKEHFAKRRMQLRFLLNDSAHAFILKYKYIQRNAIKAIKSSEVPQDMALVEYYHAKDIIQKIITQLIRKTYPDVNFDQTLLEAVGFKACRCCDQESVINLDLKSAS